MITRMSLCVAYVALLAALPFSMAQNNPTPHFKWAQTIYNIFITVIVKDCDRSSVVVDLQSVEHLSFSAVSEADGKTYVLELPLREDVRLHSDNTSWSIASRDNRFGTQVVITLTKLNMHRWDRFLTDASLYRQFMEKDWSRDNSTLEAIEEFPYQEKFAAHLLAVTESNFNETIAKSRPLFLNVKYPWCHACKKLDPVFQWVAGEIKKKGKKDPAFAAVAFGVLDPREERALGRRFGHGLAPKCGVCEVKVLTEVGEEAEYIKGIEDIEDLEKKVPLYMVPAVEILSSLQDPSLEALKVANVTCYGAFASEDSPRYKLFKNVSRIMRGELKFAAAFGEDGPLQMWQRDSKKLHSFEGNWNDEGSELKSWVKSHSLPLLQVFSWRNSPRYTDLGLPMAKIWFETQGDGKLQFFNGKVRSVVRRLAAEFLGKVAFVESSRIGGGIHELNDFMLDHPEVYPAFGVQTNNSDKAQRYGFPITADIAPSVDAFWNDEESALAHLREFLKSALSGNLPAAQESTVPEANWVPGSTRNLCWREYSEIENPTRPLLLELWSRFRVDSEEKSKATQGLAEVLLPYADNFTVARYDTGSNYFYLDHFKARTRQATGSEWYWITRNESAAGKGKPILHKLTNPKLDASPRGVLDFAKRRSGLDLDIDELMRQHERKLKVYTKFKKFSKLNELGHDESEKFPRGFNVLVHVVEVGDVEIVASGIEQRTAVVGDATGSVKMRFVGETELPLAAVGTVIEVRNAKIILVQGIVVISVGKFGLIVAHDGEVDVVANIENDFSQQVFKDKKGKHRDEL